MLACKRSKFTLPKNVTYLNCAYMAPLMKSVEKAGIRGLRRKRNPGVDITAQDFFTDGEILRQEYARLINASDAKRVVIIPSVSYGIATVTRNINLKRDQHIVVAAEQFPSNYYPWQALCDQTSAQMKIVAPPQKLTDRGKIWNERVLESIDKNTGAVAIANTHWADGTKFDLMAIRKRTREVGALLIVDGTQSVGALPFDVSVLQPDALICAGYKWLLGPYAFGLAYYGEYFDQGKPIEENWLNRLKSEDFAALVIYQSAYQPGALRYEVGEHSNFIMVPMMQKALEQINRWGVANIQEYCAHISQPAIATLREKGFWVEDENYRGGHLFGVRIPKEMSVEKIKTALIKNNVFVSLRGDAIRVAPNIYNHERDMEKFVRILSRT